MNPTNTTSTEPEVEVATRKYNLSDLIRAGSALTEREQFAYFTYGDYDTRPDMHRWRYVQAACANGAALIGLLQVMQDDPDLSSMDWCDIEAHSGHAPRLMDDEFWASKYIANHVTIPGYATREAEPAVQAAFYGGDPEEWASSKVSVRNMIDTYNHHHTREEIADLLDSLGY